MNLRPLFFTLTCYLLVFSCYSQVIDVGLYYTGKLKKVIVIPESGAFEFYGDGVRISELGETDGLRIASDNGKISLKSLSNDFTKSAQIPF